MIFFLSCGITNVNFTKPWNCLHNMADAAAGEMQKQQEVLSSCCFYPVGY
jgi:hypothetical protein